jgi:hypothetical protein
MNTTALQTQTVGLTPVTKSTNTNPPPLFDKGTHHLAKIEDTYGYVYIFSLPRDVIPTYANAMKEGDLIALRMNKEDRFFRQPFTDLKLDEYTYTFNFLKKIPVGDTVKTFHKRIEKILHPEAKEILLRGGIKGAEKLKELQVGVAAEPTKVVTAPVAPLAAATPAPAGELPVMYRGKALTKVGDYYYRYDVQTCIHCHGLINTQSQVAVRDGKGIGQATKKAVDHDAHRVAGSRVDWAHDKCRDEKAGVGADTGKRLVDMGEHQEPAGVVDEAVLQHQREVAATLAGDLDKTKDLGANPPQSPEPLLAAKMLVVLNRGFATPDWKVGYLTAYFEQMAEKK